jgi:hypothetical protein
MTYLKKSTNGKLIKIFKDCTVIYGVSALISVLHLLHPFLPSFHVNNDEPALCGWQLLISYTYVHTYI